MQQDPLSFRAGDANLYRYVGNGPTLRIDPSGLTPRQGATMLSAVALTRARDCYGVFNSIHLFIDGEEVGTVHYGCRKVFHLTPGAHSLWFRMDWFRSSPYEVTISPGELIELEASLRWRGFAQCLSAFAIFIIPGRVFVVRPAPDPEATDPDEDLWECLRVIFGWLFTGLLLMLLLRLLFF
jgi:hypothetical protein